MKQAVAGSASSATSVYIRASWAYWLRNGFSAVSTAAIQAALMLRKIARAAHQATGMASSANSSDSARTPASVLPAALSQ